MQRVFSSLFSMEDAVRGLSALWWVLLALCAWSGAGCRSEQPVGSARFVGHFAQALEAGGVTRVSVALSASDLDTRTVELVEDGGAWSGTMEAIPAGEQRTFSAEAFDSAGTRRYSGQATGVTILAGQTALVAITLQSLSAPPPFTNAVPVIDAVVASARAVAPGATVSLQATAHDANPGEALTYAWTAPAGTFSAASNAATLWSAPSAPGLVTLTLTVSDPHGASATLSLTLTVREGSGGADIDVSLNTWPQVARITAVPSTVEPGQSTTVVVTASDADGDALGYQWSAVGCTGSWTGADAASAHFTPSAPPPGGRCDCHLGVTVSDGRGGQARGTLSLCVGAPPTATFPPELVAVSRSSATASPGATLTLRVEAADPQGSALGFAWSASRGTLGTPVNGASASEVSWTAPPCTSTGNPSITATVSNALGLSTAYTFTFGGLPECFVPPHGSWTTIGGLRKDVELVTATLLPSGQVLVAGGRTGSGVSETVTELYDPGAGLALMTGFMTASHLFHTATLLPSGQVLMAGGGTATAELYTPGAGTWSLTGALSTERSQHTATLLPSGQVLVVGGHGKSGSTVLATAELYNPATGTWSPAASTSVSHRGHTATLLPSGRVLVAGGDSAVTELYDPATGTWTPTGALGAPRRGHAAALLPSGKVLLLGGLGGSGEVLRTAELYDPATGAWSPTGALGAAHVQVPAVVLPSGKVLVAGGGSAAAELYDPATGTWTASASLFKPRQGNALVSLPSGEALVLGGGPDSTAAEVFDPVLEQWTSAGAQGPNRASASLTLLPSGKVLAAGGFTKFAGTSIATASLYDPATRSWRFTGSLSTPRFNHTETLLPSGKVLVVGGQVTNTVILDSVELYDPMKGTWSSVSHMRFARDLHEAVLLPSGKVLVVGGGNHVPPEVYDPATDTWSLTDVSFPAFFGYGQTATLLPSGKVLVTGGAAEYDTFHKEASLYDPATNAWSPTGSMAFARWEHKAALLPSGKVLVVTGSGESEASELYDPVTGTWSLTGALSGKRFSATATLLPSGKVLVVGGDPADGWSLLEIRADVYDPALGTWSAVQSTHSLRARHRAQLLPSGEVLLVGSGYENWSPSMLYTP